MRHEQLSVGELTVERMIIPNTVTPLAGNAASGGVLQLGTASARVIGDTANMRFLNFNFDSGATSGDARALYLRLYITGAGGGGEALRAFTTVENVIGASAHGAHISLNFGTSGKLTGQGIAMRATLQMPSTALAASNVTYSAVQAEIYSDAATSDPAGNLLSAFMAVNNGNATGMADVDDDCALLHLVGWTDATGNMLYGQTLRIRVATTDKYLLMSGSQNRLDLSGINVDAANTDGGVIKIGTASAKVTEDTANMKFVSMYFDDGATSGEAVGQYLRLYVTGVGGSGIAARIFGTVLDVAAVDARGAHISLSFGSTGTVTGSGQALTTTLHIANQATQAGTLSAITAEISSDGDDSDPAGASLSVLRCSNTGNANGKADVDDDCFFINLDSGWTIGDANMVAIDNSPGTTPNAVYSVKCRMPDGATAYLYLGTTALTA